MKFSVEIALFIAELRSERGPRKGTANRNVIQFIALHHQRATGGDRPFHAFILSPKICSHTTTQSDPF